MGKHAILRRNQLVGSGCIPFVGLKLDVLATFRKTAVRASVSKGGGHLLGSRGEAVVLRRLDLHDFAIDNRTVFVAPKPVTAFEVISGTFVCIFDDACAAAFTKSGHFVAV